MNCCQTQSLSGTDKFFTKQSDRYLKQFRKKGLAKEQRMLLEGISSLGLEGKSILEIGCGVGGLHLTMLKQDASFATGIDISEGMLNGAKRLCHELGLEQKATYLRGDFVQRNAMVPQADIVVLDKVVCCYENISDLLKKSTDKSKQVYAFTYPNPNIVVHISFKGLILLGTLFKWVFRPYWHDWEEIIREVEKQGFKQTYKNSTLMWQVRVFER
ncbi:MAG: methyltransferase domain-containing protein [Ignavibacteriae bacterium]|nr:methyltransferase domain-containing protein [Ignavibacteriota bacterium]